MNKLSEEQLVAAICQRLDKSIAHLEPTLAVRLDAARESALSLNLTQQSQVAADDDPLLIGGVLNTLDDNSELSPEIEHRLDQIRHQAMQRLSQQKSPGRVDQPILGWLKDFREFLHNGVSYPLGMVATACLTVTVVSLFYLSSIEETSVGAGAEEEILLIASATEIELYENLDFYLWLEEIEQAN